MSMSNPDPTQTEILRLFARELICNGDNVRALLAQQPGAADALLAAAAQKLGGAVDVDPNAAEGVSDTEKEEP